MEVLERKSLSCYYFFLHTDCIIEFDHLRSEKGGDSENFICFLL